MSDADITECDRKCPICVSDTVHIQCAG